ncbi:hypothetical protein [Larsenimonas rhizosphaerae]|uniref:hypothetical protein n=1 Tax=Larsenimonas rhizosphaerae TaxID=2944682 RepID=UPI002034514F|nr:hypothetical protein [Larsenimonas rhizosphaerae]MCM2129963.1 hypothetical protein [Larsenimonas rhizosphaerae]
MALCLPVTRLDEELCDELAALARAAAEDHAGPFDATWQASQGWVRQVMPALGQGRALWCARDQGRLVGCVQLVRDDVPGNRHRGWVEALLEAPEKEGAIAGQLLAMLELFAGFDGCQLLMCLAPSVTLEKMLDGRQWQCAGKLPGYHIPLHGPAEPAGLYYKSLV